MTTKLPRLGYMLFSAVLSACALLQAMGQSTPTQPVSGTPFQPKPVSIPHLYWHFLAYQQHLDEAAATREEQGKNGQPLRDSLQNELGFSSVDYAQIHASALRLTDKVKDVNGRAKAIVDAAKNARSAGLLSDSAASADQEQLKSLAAERDAAIDAEITTINLHLSTEQQAALQSYLVKKFSPSNARFRPAGSKTLVSSTEMSASAGVN
jgi:hypothetical protein